MRPEVIAWFHALGPAGQNELLLHYDGVGGVALWMERYYDQFIAPAQLANAQPGEVVNMPQAGYNVYYGNIVQPNAAQQMNWLPQQQAYFNQPARYIPPEEPDAMPAKWKALNTFKVGTDPEFCGLNKDGSIVDANQFIPHDGPIGYDHNGRVAEFRPAPSRSTWRLVQNIWKLANDKERLAGLENYKWRAGAVIKNTARMGGGFETLGGHVHFDIPYMYPVAPGVDAYNPLRYTHATPEYLQRLEALDRLTLQLEELDILPKLESRKRRTESQYGKFSDTRPAGGGAKPRMEYRSPASWLYDAKTAFCVLTAYKLAAHAPKVALDILSKEPSTAEVKRFLRSFVAEDDDARFLDEKFLQNGGLKAIRGDVDADCRAAWKELPAKAE